MKATTNINIVIINNIIIVNIKEPHTWELSVSLVVEPSLHLVMVVTVFAVASVPKIPAIILPINSQFFTKFNTS